MQIPGTVVPRQYLRVDTFATELAGHLAGLVAVGEYRIELDRMDP